MRLFSVALCVLCMIAGVSGAASVSHAAALPACSSQVERDAMAVRSFQSYLMVAAVACAQDKAYNEFVTMYKTSLSDEGRQLRNYFSRVYGIGSSEKHLTDFVTDMANVWSQVHLSDMKAYCKGTWETMWYLTHGSRATYENVRSAAHQVSSHPAVMPVLCTGAISAAPKR